MDELQNTSQTLMLIIITWTLSKMLNMNQQVFGVVWDFGISNKFLGDVLFTSPWTSLEGKFREYAYIQPW